MLLAARDDASSHGGRIGGITRFALALVVGGGIALARYGWISSHRGSTVGREDATAAQTMAESGYAFGRSLADLPLVDGAGNRVQLTSLLSDTGAVLHFIDRSCGTCMSDLGAWSQAADRSRRPIVVIACNEASPVASLEGLSGRAVKVYSLLKQDLAVAPKAVPLSLLVDRSGSVTGLIPSLSRLTAASS